jgi:hypothetical protein
MNNATSLPYYKHQWFKRLLLVLSLGMVLGVLPLERLLSIQIRAEILRWLTDGTLASWCLFLLLCMCFTILLETTKGWLTGLVMLLFPLLLLPTGAIALLGLAFPLSSTWQDQAIYRNRDDYLITQGILYGRDDAVMDYRLIRTTSPQGVIRWLEECKKLPANEDSFDFLSDSISYRGKVWHKLNIFEE